MGILHCASQVLYFEESGSPWQNAYRLHGLSDLHPEPSLQSPSSIMAGAFVLCHVRLKGLVHKQNQFQCTIPLNVYEKITLVRSKDVTIKEIV